jgi:hypothetical protein
MKYETTSVYRNLQERKRFVPGTWVAGTPEHMGYRMGHALKREFSHE